jgi:hypothetical protein
VRYDFIPNSNVNVCVDALTFINQQWKRFVPDSVTVRAIRVTLAFCNAAVHPLVALALVRRVRTALKVPKVAEVPLRVNNLKLLQSRLKVSHEAIHDPAIILNKHSNIAAF